MKNNVFHMIKNIHKNVDYALQYTVWHLSYMAYVIQCLQTHRFGHFRRPQCKLEVGTMPICI